MTARPAEKNEAISTFLLAWDRDVVDSIQAHDGDVLALLCIGPSFSGPQNGWRAIRIREVWMGHDPEDGCEQCVIFVADDGRQYSGYFFEESTTAKKKELVVGGLVCHA